MIDYKLTFETYTKNLLGGRILGLKCNKCSNYIHPPRMICPKCYSTDLNIIEFNGTGEINTFTVVRVAPTWMEDIAPLIIAHIKLDEGGFILGHLSDIEADAASLDLIGKKVKMIGGREVKKDIISGVNGAIPIFQLL
ncbi:MAG TPA: Zn-ribbon domain-containing OB-fold protein [Thermoplasmata archaeon]|uniref:Zn-ribbon domain-containing OB-fold protein n=1 Tax=Candidatus Methanolliviera hydrocarbonicum TaxID=2491085 RepID=A0A520KUF1_9EURY|nr:MAG: Zn-ribbon domain-containing OB-fold protein [Candidatus Methanolliviera hydrocarbonicum]HIH98615.1 Zn-ribbon domain-containing OB-fold protein [Thermoplasmata archaeon]